MRKTTYLQWLAGVAVLLLTAGCPVDINEGEGGDDDAPTTPECPTQDRVTVRFVHMAGGTPVTRKPGVTSTRNLNVTRPDPADAAKTVTVTGLAPGRASLVRLCGNRMFTLGARLAGASKDRVTTTITLPPATPNSSELDAVMTIILAGISDALKMENGAEVPENPDSVANPLRFIVVPDTFDTGNVTQLQVVHASRKTAPMMGATVDVEVNPDKTGAEVSALARYAFSVPETTRGTADTSPSAVPVVFTQGGTELVKFSIAPRMPIGAKGLAILFDIEVFDPDNPDQTKVRPPVETKLFLTGDDPLLGAVAGGGVQF
jgi:hypothetical protein